ncbi:hypothetical protein D3C78_1226010 [compost metagenome]
MIPNSFLASVANYTNGKIAKVILNDTYEITNFVVKTVTDSTVGLQYVVPAAAVSVVTKIELKDSSNNVVCTNNVNVPIASDTLLLQTILIREGA